jgi:hypothetical protein
MLTPIKGIKGQTQCEKQHDRAYVDIFSKAVSTVRQPIESLFNWLIEKKLIFKKLLKSDLKRTIDFCLWQNCCCIYLFNLLVQHLIRITK